ncbi:MAG TPA: exo-beta-N-acetylmuramidase NamZ domain-containing protein, partial [Sphingobacteriaceae bacterium]
MKSRSLLLILFISVVFNSCGHPTSPVFNGTPNPYKVDVEALTKKPGKLKTGADQTEKYLPYLKGKTVGMVINPTSIIGTNFSVDSLRSLGVNIVKLFGPEHGFRGDASAGVSV